MSSCKYSSQELDEAVLVVNLLAACVSTMVMLDFMMVYLGSNSPAYIAFTAVSAGLLLEAVSPKRLDEKNAVEESDFQDHFAAYTGMFSWSGQDPNSASLRIWTIWTIYRTVCRPSI